MKELVQKVKQWGIDKGLDKVGHLAQAEYTLKETSELLDAYADKDIDAINDAIGDILVTLIVGASNDEVICGGVSALLYSPSIHSDSSALENLKLTKSGLAVTANALTLIEYCDEGKEDLAIYSYSIIVLKGALNGINFEFKQSLTLKDCLQLAYDEIKDRKGKLNADGHFIKDL